MSIFLDNLDKENSNVHLKVIMKLTLTEMVFGYQNENLAYC